MKKNNMYYDTQKAKIFKRYYRPSSNLTLLLKSLLSVFVSGKSPIGTPAFQKRKIH